MIELFEIDTRTRWWRFVDWVLRVPRHYSHAPQQISVASSFGFYPGLVISVGDQQWEVRSVR